MMNATLRIILHSTLTMLPQKMILYTVMSVHKSIQPSVTFNHWFHLALNQENNQVVNTFK